MESRYKHVRYICAEKKRKGGRERGGGRERKSERVRERDGMGGGWEKKKVYILLINVGY